MLNTIPYPTNQPYPTKGYEPTLSFRHLPDSLVNRLLNRPANMPTIPLPSNFTPLCPWYAKRFRINSKQHSNLVKLYNGLTALYEEKKTMFDMNIWAEDHVQAINCDSSHTCNTPACALGYAPSCGIPVPKGLKLFRNFEYNKSWYKYAKQFTQSDYVHKFLFSPRWAKHINEENGFCQMKEAIARIKYVLDGKLTNEFNITKSYA